MHTSGTRSTEVYVPQWPVAPIGVDQTPEPIPDVYKDTLAFIKQRIRRAPKGGHVITLDSGEAVPLQEYLASSDFWNRWDFSTPEKIQAGTIEIRSILDRFLGKPVVDQPIPNNQPQLFDDDFMQQGSDSIIEQPMAEASHGAFVTLSARASSIAAIMEAYSTANQARHVNAENEDPDSDFKDRYDSEQKGLANRVARGMGYNANRLLGTVGAHLNILNDSAGMLRVGFSQAELQDIRGDMKEELTEGFSESGPDVVKRRHKEIAIVVKTAELARRAQHIQGKQ